MNISCKAILFDLDGVLVDSIAVVQRHWTRWADANDISYEELKSVAFGLTSTEVVALLAPHLDAEAEGRRMQAAEAADTDGLIIFPAAGPLLRSLPDGRWAVATSGDRATATTRLTFGELPIPAVFVTADDVGQGKPHPEPYLKAAAELGFDAADCVVVEDTPAGVKAGQASGARVIAVATTHSAEELAAADLVVGDLGALAVTAGEDGGLVITISA